MAITLKIIIESVPVSSVKSILKTGSQNGMYHVRLKRTGLLRSIFTQGILALIDDPGSVTGHLVERDFPGTVVAIVEPLQINSLDT